MLCAELRDRKATMLESMTECVDAFARTTPLMPGSS